MAARVGAMLPLQFHLNGVGHSFSKEFKELGNTIVLGLGWLRAVARGYSYSCNKLELDSKFQMNLMSWGIRLSWGWGGCALWRRVAITIAVALNWLVICRGIYRVVT